MIFEGWGIALSSGEVKPANQDEPVYWTDYAIHASANMAVNSPIHIVHQDDFVDIGEVTNYAIFQDNLFVKYKLYKQKWKNFVSDVESKENVNIGTTFNQLTREIESGNMALSAGVNTLIAPTKRHERTVVAVSSWNETSLVPAPASPGAWTAACTDECEEAFQTMGNDLIEALQQGNEETDGGEDGDTSLDQPVNVPFDEAGSLVINQDGVTISPEEEAPETPDEKLQQKLKQKEQELEQVKEERDEYKEKVEQVRQIKRDEQKQRIENINQSLPEDSQKSEEEIEQLTEGADIERLSQVVDMMETVAEAAEPETDVHSGKEDLTGSSETGNNSAEERVEQVSRELFGKDVEEVIDGYDNPDPREDG